MHTSSICIISTIYTQVIERFLGSNVRYVVTNRSRDEIKRSTASSGQSPITPSPLTPSPSSYTPKALSGSTCVSCVYNALVSLLTS